MTFANAGTLPDSFSVTLTNTRPAALPGALPRKFALAFTGGSAYSATLRLHYRDSDLSGLAESSIAPWHLAGSVWQIQPSSAASTAQNWVECAGVTGPGDWGLAAPHRLFLPLLQRADGGGGTWTTAAREILHISAAGAAVARRINWVR